MPITRPPKTPMSEPERAQLKKQLINLGNISKPDNIFLSRLREHAFVQVVIKDLVLLAAYPLFEYQPDLLERLNELSVIIVALPRTTQERDALSYNTLCNLLDVVAFMRSTAHNIRRMNIDLVELYKRSGRSYSDIGDQYKEVLKRINRAWHHIYILLIDMIQRTETGKRIMNGKSGSRLPLYSGLSKYLQLLEGTTARIWQEEYHNRAFTKDDLPRPFTPPHKLLVQRLEDNLFEVLGSLLETSKKTIPEDKQTHMTFIANLTGIMADLFLKNVRFFSSTFGRGDNKELLATEMTIKLHKAIDEAIDPQQKDEILLAAYSHVVDNKWHYKGLDWWQNKRLDRSVRALCEYRNSGKAKAADDAAAAAAAAPIAPPPIAAASTIMMFPSAQGGGAAAAPAAPEAQAMKLLR